MAVFRVEKSTSYSVISNYHFKEKNMSLKAKGLLSEMLSLTESWDYSSRGLAAINKEGKNSINRILQELEEFGYLKRKPIKSEDGQIIDWEYTIYEMPQITKNVILEQFAPCTKNEDMENEDMENRYNNKILTNSNSNNSQKEILEILEVEFGRLLSPMEIEVAIAWKFPVEIVKLAIKEAVTSNNCVMKYIDKILYNWEKSGVKSVKDAEYQMKLFREAKEKKKNNLPERHAETTGANYYQRL